MKIKITLFVLGKEFSAVADTIAEAYEYVKAIAVLYSEAFPDRDETLSECMEILSVEIRGGLYKAQKLSVYDRENKR